MKIIFAAAVMALTGFQSCNKQNSSAALSKNGSLPGDTTTPACVLNIIRSIQNEPVHNPPAEVYRYTWHNQQVYYITANCCDQYNLLYDANCNVLCAPDGGFSGAGDGRCTDFGTAGSSKTLVWKDPR